MSPSPIPKTLFISSRGCTKMLRNPNFANVIFLGTSKISKLTSWGTLWYQSRRALGGGEWNLDLLPYYKGCNFLQNCNKFSKFQVGCYYDNYKYVQQINRECCDKHFGISLFILTTTWENNGFCIFQGQMTRQVETMILCKSVACVTLNFLYLDHNTSKLSTWYVLYICVMYRTLYKIFTLQHKMKVGESRNFS